MSTSYISSLNAVGTFQGLNIYDSNTPGSLINPGVVNPYSVLTVPAYWRAINFLSNNLASFPRSVRLDGQRLEVASPLDKLLARKPNEMQNAWQFWTTLFFHFNHYGGGFAKIKRTPGGGVDSLHNVLPDNIVPFRWDDADGNGPRQYYFNRAPQEVIAAADMVHLSSLSYDGMAGYNPVWLMRETLQRAMLLDRYQTRFLSRGSVIRGSIEIPKEATDDQIGKIVDTIRQYFSGADADRDLVVLAGGAALKNATMSPKDSELGWQATYSTKQIAQIMGVDPYFLFDSSESKYNGNPEQAGQNVVRYTFRPLIEQIECELSGKLLSEADQDKGLRVYLEPKALLRGDTQIESAVVIAQVNGGILTRNEGRAVLGLPPDSDPASDKLSVLGDTTVNQPQPGDAPADPSDPDAPSTNELRSTVGGSSSLLSIQEAYYAGDIPRAAAIASAMMLFGFTQAEVDRLFPDLEPENKPDAEPSATPEPDEPIENSRNPGDRFAAGHRFASTHIALTGEIADAMQGLSSGIPDSDFSGERPKSFCVSIKGGLHYNAPDRVAAVAQNFGLIKMKFGATASAACGAFDEIRCPINSPDAQRLCASIAATNLHTATAADFDSAPHFVVARVKPGRGDQYAGRMDLHGKEFTADTLLHSDRDGNVTPIPLNTGDAGSDPRLKVSEAMWPVLNSAAQRVDTKSDKAFAARAGASVDELTMWANKFSGDQQRYAREALLPICEAMALVGPKIDAADVAEQYGNAIMHRAMGEPWKTLAELLETFGGPGSGPHPGNGKKKKEPDEERHAKAAIAKASATYVGKDIQRYAEEHNEPQFAKSIGGLSYKDNEPVDVVAGSGGVVNAGVELKTMVSNKAGKITMDRYAQVRKAIWEQSNNATLHTVLIDDRNVYNAKGEGQHDESQRQYYYRRGVAGSARIKSLHKCANIEEVKSLMAAKESELPSGAKRTDAGLHEGKWKPQKDGSFKNSKTGEVVKKKK